MAKFFSQFGKVLAFAGLFAFLSVGAWDGAKAYAHPTESCSAHSLASHDCHDTDHGHSHGPKQDQQNKDDHCALGHCHGSHGSWVGAHCVPHLVVPALVKLEDSSVVSAYLNPFLSKPLQPPRA